MEPPSQLAIKVDDKTQVDISRSSTTKLSLKHVKVATYSGAYYPRKNATAQITAARVTIEVGSATQAQRLRVESQTDGMNHFGITLKNRFKVTVGHHSFSFGHCLAHVMKQTKNTKKPKVDLFFAPSLEECQMRMLVVGEPKLTAEKPFITTTPLKRVGEELARQVQPEFRDYVAGVRDAAMRNDLRQTNCWFGSTRMLAVLRGDDPDEAMKAAVASNRGKLLRWSGKKLQPGDEVPCTDVVWWNTVREKKVAGTVYRMQNHKSDGDSLGHSLIKWGRHHAGSIHKEMWRVIKRKPGMGKEYIGFGLFSAEKWWEMDRGNESALLARTWSHI